MPSDLLTRIARHQYYRLMPYEPIVPKGHRLGNSHKVDDAVTGHLFDDQTNELKGHAAWRWVEEPCDDYLSGPEHDASAGLTQEESDWAEALALLIVLGTVKATIAATPRLRRWWNGKVSPLLEVVWERVTRATKSRVQGGTPSPAPGKMLVGTPSAVERSVVESKIKMTRAEWEQRYRAMVVAGAFKDEQLRILSSAQIEDGDPLQLKDTADQLTPQQLVDRVKLMLKANPSLLDEDTSAELIRIFSAPLSPSEHRGSEVEAESRSKEGP